MGNQLVGIAPPEIYPVEHYFPGTFGNELLFDSSMGSTRFFKVARAKCSEGLAVVKVFVIHDPSLPLEQHKKRIELIKKTLANAVNCLPFQRIELTDKAGYIMREYVKHSLYDRVSTRPFLSILEKKWITFQILCALNQCHKQKICHGDIKLENILITSWNWILLSDFASFKPTYLPEDNPADYTYFFDTSRRRTCYIAPERFVKTIDVAQDKDMPLVTDSILLPSGSLVRTGPYHSGALLPEMDIFSAGCALLELWTEGTAPFEFSQLLAYSKGEKDLVKKHLQRIENENLRSLLSSMLHLNPKERRSAEVYLDQERGNLFPEYFYSFLQSYLQMFSSLPIMSADDKILRLYSDIDHCVQVLTNQSKLKRESIKNNKNAQETCYCIPEHDGLILIITVVTSCIRGLNHCHTKICCLEILQKLSEFTISETILDRILPYILHLAQDSSSLVQAQAVDTLTNCLSMVKDIPRSDANIFPEYILPAIASLSADPSTIVRVSYARNIAKLAKTAVYFLEETQRNAPNDLSTQRYEAELNALHEIIQQTVLSLLTDQQSVVKQTLIESGICDLCAFFGKQKANDVILSHIITFLNDKEDKHLRGSFFESIVGVVGYVGWQSSDIIIPLLQQGLTDSEEFVIAKAIRTTTALIDMGHLQKHAIIEFISESACYLNHPNLWIRHEMCGLISTTARKLSSIDVQCRIMPVITNFIKTPLIQVEKPEIILDCLNPAVPRRIFDSVVKFNDINTLFKVLEERKDIRNQIPSGSTPEYGEMNTAIKNLFRRLSSEGLTEFVELQLLSMQTFLIKLNKYKNIESKHAKNGQINLRRKNINCHEFPLRGEKWLQNDGIARKLRVPDSGNDNIAPHTNLNWQHIDEHRASIPPSLSHESIYLNNQAAPPNQCVITPNSALFEYSLPERNFWQEHSSECRQQLDKLKTKFKSRYSALASNQEYDTPRFCSPIPSGWRMNGSLVAHLHEHSASVTKIVALKPGTLFASGSIDGTVRLWDCNKLNGNQTINKSRQMYLAKTPVYSIAPCDGGQSLAVGGKDSSLVILRIDRNSSKMALQTAIYLDENKNGHDEGSIVDMQPFEQNCSSLIVFATLYGNIIAWDMRMQDSVWKLQNELKHGVITTICADPSGSWLAAGTSGGKHICWDLRFRLPIAEIRHPSDSWIRKITCHPTEPSCLISASQSNNEVSIWNIETGHRQTVLWASAAPVLSNTSMNNPSTSCGILTGVVDECPFILTGSSDQRIRYWDLVSPENSSLIVPSSKDQMTDISFVYDTGLIDGSRVIQEKIIRLGNSELATRNSEEQPRCGPEMPTSSHNDGITDLLMCKTEKHQNLIVSSSRDGVIKIWK
ncbi:phosphoinositide 3-kinase regulatory subunit 4 [Condylostylus longicornis]|uniref:phosphoinositide 3-kinase regulatory subunit 4 n=1 Tax=Condylostylus longicornis TaxID=2530218 RepID=UPI00244E4173|nr:phosphoinositide 3-kinase regulatory subunit 4 [Condylostylus longicornis]